MKKSFLFSVLVFISMFLPACSDASSGGEGDGPPIRIVFVTHGQASDPFWSVVQNGARQAGRDLGVRVEYQAPESFDMVTMGQLIDAAAASKPDGLVVSIADADALAAPIRRAIEAGIPVVSINSGDDAAEALGVLNHIGLPEYQAGYGGGRRMAEMGARRGLCVNHELGNVSLDQRCAGFLDALGEAGATGLEVAVELGDPTESQQRIQATLRSDPSIDAILTLGPAAVVPALRAVEEVGATGRLRLGAFDLSPETLDAVASGDLAFAIDQQQYLQGYLPVVLLALYVRNANTVANEVLRTGPDFVTAENVERLRHLTDLGTR